MAPDRLLDHVLYALRGQPVLNALDFRFLRVAVVHQGVALR